jgi:hypothetical protein
MLQLSKEIAESGEELPPFVFHPEMEKAGSSETSVPTTTTNSVDTFMVTSTIT